MISLLVELIFSLSLSVFLFFRIKKERAKEKNAQNKKKILIYRVIFLGLLAIAVITFLQILLFRFSMMTKGSAL